MSDQPRRDTGYTDLVRFLDHGMKTQELIRKTGSYELEKNHLVRITDGTTRCGGRGTRIEYQTPEKFMAVTICRGFSEITVAGYHEIIPGYSEWIRDIWGKPVQTRRLQTDNLAEIIKEIEKIK